MTVYVEFEDALRDFVKDICDGFSHIEMPTRLWTRIVRKNEGISFPREERPDFGRIQLSLLVEMHRNPTEALQHVLNVVRGDPELSGKLLSYGAGKPIAENELDQSRGTSQLAGSFLRTYLDRGGELAFEDTTFDMAFHDLIAEIESSVLDASEVSTLRNCRLDCKRINIAPGLLIRKLSTNEVEGWLNQHMEFPSITSHMMPIDPWISDCAIEASYERSRYEAWGSPEDITNKVSDLLTTLRILTDRNVNIAFTQYMSNSILEPNGGTSSSLLPRRLGPQDLIDPSMQQEIVNTWGNIQVLPANSRIRLALRRWGNLSERFHEDDAMIDYWIALEALFVPESTQEVRYQASLRVAAFIGSTTEERVRVYKDLRNSYDLRSAIVHGRVPKSEQKLNLTRIHRRTRMDGVRAAEGGG